MIHPAGSHILVKLFEEKEEKSGIIIPNEKKEYIVAEIVEIGPLVHDSVARFHIGPNTGEVANRKVKLDVGVKIILRKSPFIRARHENKEFAFVVYEDILGYYS